MIQHCGFFLSQVVISHIGQKDGIIFDQFLQLVRKRIGSKQLIFQSAGLHDFGQFPPFSRLPFHQRNNRRTIHPDKGSGPVVLPERVIGGRDFQLCFIYNSTGLFRCPVKRKNIFALLNLQLPGAGGSTIRKQAQRPFRLHRAVDLHLNIIAFPLVQGGREIQSGQLHFPGRHGIQKHTIHTDPLLPQSIGPHGSVPCILCPVRQNNDPFPPIGGK